jgi:hypothetical protein
MYSSYVLSSLSILLISAIHSRVSRKLFGFLFFFPDIPLLPLPHVYCRDFIILISCTILSFLPVSQFYLPLAPSLLLLFLAFILLPSLAFVSLFACLALLLCFSSHLSLSSYNYNRWDSRCFCCLFFLFFLLYFVLLLFSFILVASASLPYNAAILFHTHILYLPLYPMIYTFVADILAFAFVTLAARARFASFLITNFCNSLSNFCWLFTSLWLLHVN